MLLGLGAWMLDVKQAYGSNAAVWGMAAWAMMAWTVWNIQRSRTRLNAEGMHQSWIWNKQMAMSDLAYAQLGLAMYYYLTRDEATLRDIKRLKPVLAGRSGERRVLRLADRETPGVIAGQRLNRGQGIPPRQLDLSHVADVEQAAARAHRLVLVENALVLHRHIPAGEIDHPAAMGAMGSPARLATARRPPRLRNRRSAPVASA